MEATPHRAATHNGMFSVRRVKIVVAVLLIVAVFPLSAAAQRRADLAGVYRCTGTDPDGTDYHGVVMISRRGDAFQVQWRIPSAPVTIGLGIVTGDVLAVSYFGSGPGVASYRINDEQLIGTWTQPAAGGVLYRETLTRVHEGEYLEPDPAPGTVGI